MLDLSTDYQIVLAILNGLSEDEPVYLITVVDTWGSAPRRPGAQMAIQADGQFVGSVSGGCVEDDLVSRVMRGEFESGPPRIESYGIKQEQSRRVGLPCGGRLTLLVERVENASDFDQLSEALHNRRGLAREVDVSTGESRISEATDGCAFHFEDKRLVKVYGPQWRMLLIGAGELSRRVAQLALTLDYAVTICDPRPEYAADWRVEGADFVTTATSLTVDDFGPDPHSIILALSHTPALDDGALAQALKSDAFYVGALGSMGTQRGFAKRLRKRDISEDQLANLHGPVGLNIGSRTPGEIAISIIADLIQHRNLPA